MAVLLPHLEVEIIGGEERGGVLKNGVAAIGDFRGLVNGESGMASNEGVSCALLVRRQ